MIMHHTACPKNHAHVNTSPYSQLLEFAKECIQLGPLYGFSQPLAVLKTRVLYRYVKHIPAPRIQEVDDDGHVVGQNNMQLQPVSWRKIRCDARCVFFYLLRIHVMCVSDVI